MKYINNCCILSKGNTMSESNTVCTAGTTNFFSWYPPINKCFGPLIPGHSPGGGPAVVVSHYELVVGFQLLSSLFIHNQLDALSAARLSVPTARFLSAPLIPKALNIFHSDCAGNPLAPISTGKSHTRHPFCLHCSCRSEYLAFFLS